MKSLISLLGICLLAQIAFGSMPDLDKSLKEVVNSLSGELHLLKNDLKALKIDHEAQKIDHEALKIDHEALKETVAGRENMLNTDQVKKFEK
jgi:hypothetical protein